MKTIIEKIGEYNKCVQGLLDRLNEFESQVKTEINFELWHEFSIEKFGRGQACNYELSIDGKRVPGHINKLGKNEYMGGDFNSPTEFSTSAEIIDWAKQLPVFIKNLESKFQERIKEAQNIESQILCFRVV